MKNFGIFVLGIILGAIIMYFYFSKDQTEMPNTIAEVKIPGLITPKEAKTLDQAFNLKHRIINDSLFKGSETGDNRSSWWALEDIQNYINYAENEAGELGYTMNGLRVYLGAYPSAKGETGLTTMFFIPTGSKNTSQGNTFPIYQDAGKDIPGSKGLNIGQQGDPPDANYPN